MTGTTTHDVMVAQTEKATELLNYFQGQRANHEARIAAKEAEVNAYLSSARSELPFGMVHNDNHDFLDTTTYTHTDGTVYKLPVGIALNAGGFWDKFTTEIIPVTTGVDPTTRNPIAIELLTAMGSNTTHLGGNFNILHVKRRPSSATPTSYTFGIPKSQLRSGTGKTFVAWARTNGAWSWLGDTGGQWKQVRVVYPPASGTGSPLAYIHVTPYSPNTGTEYAYLALPSIVSGVWPADRKLGLLDPSPVTQATRALA